MLDCLLLYNIYEYLNIYVCMNECMYAFVILIDFNQDYVYVCMYVCMYVLMYIHEFIDETNPKTLSY